MVMALDGIKVLDLSRLAPGPHCSMLLADFGADVTLVEAVPGSSAKLGSVGLRRSEAADRAAAYNALGRGKKSIALNLKDDAAREIFYALVKQADVVIEGFRPGVVKRLGVDYETLARINPRIICCSISGFGQTGPYSNLVGHDINYISIGGALGVTGRPGQAPAIPVNLVADFAGGGLTAAFQVRKFFAVGGVERLVHALAEAPVGLDEVLALTGQDRVAASSPTHFRPYQRKAEVRFEFLHFPPGAAVGESHRGGRLGE